MFNSHNGGHYSREEVRRILRPINDSSNDSPNSSKGNNAGAAKGPLPLATDIVGLPSQHSGNGRVRSGSDEEDTKILHTRGRDPFQDTQTNDGLQRIINNNRAPNVPLVPCPSLRIHQKAGKEIWWRSQGL